MPKLLRTSAAILTVATLACLIGFAASGGPGRAARPWMVGLVICFAVMGLAAAYMAFVGLYHTILALFGWDGGPGMIRKNPHYIPGSDEPLEEDTRLHVPEAPNELVRMSPDLKLATIFIMPLGGKDIEPVLAALTKHKKFIRGEIAHRVNLKSAPEVRFLADESFDKGAYIDRLLKSPVVTRDTAKPDTGKPDATED